MPTLFPYQVDGVNFLRACTAAHGAALLADDMGVGKTPQFLSAPMPGSAAIVVVPAALKSQTAERIVQWRGTSTRVAVLDGIGSWRAPGPGEWLVMNPELLPAAPSETKRAEREIAEAADEAVLDFAKSDRGSRAAKRLDALADRGSIEKGALPHGCWLLVDEAHEFNTATTAQTARLRALVAAVRAAGGFTVAATATPLLNDPSELRGLLATLRLGGVAWPAPKGRALNYWSFLRDWGGSKGRYGEEWGGEPRDERIAAALSRVMLRRMFRDVVSVPPMLPTTRISVDLDAGLRAMADDADEMLRRRSGDLDRGAKLVFETVSKVRAALAVAKLPAAHAWCDAQEKAGEPAVVACVSVDVVRNIAARRGWGRISGAESAEQRSEIVRAFQAGDLRGVALTHAAGGVGIDLFRSARMLMVSREWNPARNRQTLARVLRQGQTRRVGLSLLLGAHAIEDRLDELLAGRKRLMQAIDASAVRPGAAA